MVNRAKGFADKAERYSRDRRRMAGDGEAVARRILACAERVEALDPRAASDSDRAAALARIWDAYAVVCAWLDSNAPHDLDSPEVPFGSYIEGVDSNGGYYSPEWDGCPAQVHVDLVYEGH